MSSFETAVAVRVISSVLNDLYIAGKARFEMPLSKWKNKTPQRTLVNKVASTEKVKTFWQKDKEVPLTTFYYPSKVSYPDSLPKPYRSLRDFPKTGNFVIQGTVGQGKSIFLRYLCVQELKENGSGRIPIFIELRTITSRGLKDAIINGFDRLGFVIDEDLFDFYANSGKIVLLLDAFDELDEGLVSSVTNQLENLVEKYDSLQVFVTSRPGSAIQNSRHFRVMHLARLEKSDQKPFLERIGVSETEIERILNSISKSSTEIAGLLTTPLIMTLLVVVYNSENTIPTDLPEFYEKLFQTLFSKHDTSKPGYIRAHKSGLGERKLQQLFEAFCFSTLRNKKTTKLTNEDFNILFDYALKFVDTPCSIEGFRHDITRVACLLIEDGFEFYFLHKSVLEFYAALFIKGRNEEWANKFYSRLVDNEQWRLWSQVLSFLSTIDRYRYIKYFALPSINEAIKYFNLPEDIEQIKDPLGIIRILFPDMRVTFASDSLGNYKISTIGPDLTHTKFFLQMVGPDYYLHYVVKSEKPCSRDELLKRFPSICTLPGNYLNEREVFHIGWEDMLTPEDLDYLLARFTLQLDRELITNRKKYFEYIKVEDSKMDLLDF